MTGVISMRALLLTVLVSLAGCQLPGTDPGKGIGGGTGLPRFEVEVHRPENGHRLPREIGVDLAGDTVIFNVTDAFGIGSGTVRLVEGAWPQKVLVRYHLGGLEGASATLDGKLLLDSREDSLGALGVRMLDKKGRPLEGKYLLKKDGYYEARIPPKALAGGARELKLTWVDFYRG